MYDLGGGTFDVSFLPIDVEVFEGLANKNTHSGGEDFDQRLMDYFAIIFNRKFKANLTDDK